jgi:hypothetical protein
MRDAQSILPYKLYAGSKSMRHWLHIRSSFAMRPQRTTILCHVAIYMPILRVEIPPPLVAITIKKVPILHVVNNMTRSQTVSVIGHILFTNKRDPCDDPFANSKTHNNNLNVSKIFSLTKCHQNPCHSFHHLDPLVLTGFLQSQCIFNDGHQLFFDGFCLPSVKLQSPT